MKTSEQLYYPDGEFAKYQKVNNGRYFKIVARKMEHKILPSVSIEGFGFNGMIPGPLIVVEQGDWLYLEVKNELDEPTSLHVHGLSKPNSQDGIPEIEPTPSIEPGESYTYRFNCWQAGTFFYHSGNPLHISLGLMGGFIVLPKNPKHTPRDYVFILQQWELPQPQKGEITPGTYMPEKFDVNPNFFTINGKSFPHTSPLYTKYGERIRIRFINKSSAAHSMHIHGHDFAVTEIDGFPRNEFLDTVNVPSGQRITIELLASNPGIWPINGTKTFHQTNNGVTPGGMITRLIYQ